MREAREHEAPAILERPRPNGLPRWSRSVNSPIGRGSGKDRARAERERRIEARRVRPPMPSGDRGRGKSDYSGTGLHGPRGYSGREPPFQASRFGMRGVSADRA